MTNLGFVYKFKKMERRATIKRKTKETEVSVELAIEGKGKVKISTPSSFLNHMLESMALHGFFDLFLEAKGDIKVDMHHTVEDIGISLGGAFKKALGNYEGIKRYGSAAIPMDEALALVSLDICNRPYLVINTPLNKGKVGDFDVELIKVFFQAFSTHSGIALHVNVPYGENNHHIIEAIFKSLGRALDRATALDERIEGVISRKGKL